MANISKRLSERSSRSTDNRQIDKDMEYFWSVVLSSEKRSVTWVISESAEDDDDTDLVHTLFLKLAVLGGNAVSGEQNIVVLQSTGEDGKPQKGAIAHLTRGLNPMTQLDLIISGKIGGTFILSEGVGPVTIAGNHMVVNDADGMDDTQMDEFTAEEENVENELNESDDESEEEIKDKKSAKRKATPKAIKHKQKAKMDVDDDQSGEDEEEGDDDDDEDDEDYDFGKEVKNKKFKKGKVAGKKNEKAAKTKPEKDSGKKSGKNVKK